MEINPTELPGVMLIKPAVFADSRGFFCETYQRQRFHDAGIAVDFLQDNHSRSSRGTLRGLHYQIEHAQGKLVWATRGEVFDVVVDMRRHSPTFGRWLGTYLSDENHFQLYVPPGFAHGIFVVSNEADLVYKCTDYYFPQHERTVLWNDRTLNISWPLNGPPLISAKDSRGLTFAESPCF